jgi:hypothetical protein
MAGGLVAVAGVTQDRAELYHNRLTLICFIYCLLISWAGGLFGLDLDKRLSLMSACVPCMSLPSTWHLTCWSMCNHMHLQPCSLELTSWDRQRHTCSHSFEEECWSWKWRSIL